MNILISKHYIKRKYPPETKIAEIYDADPVLQSAVNTLIKDFEYPDWQHRTVQEVLKANHNT